MSSVVGIDLGSRTTKIVQIRDGTVCYTDIFPTSHNPLVRVRAVLSRIDTSSLIATGYGRHLVREHFDAKTVTEITACAVGVYHQFPRCRTVLDVGGQDCKVIHMGEDGKVLDFEMNDRCAAGTGRFLEVMA